MGDFMQKSRVLETPFLTPGRSTVSSKWLIPQIYISKDAQLHGLLHAF